MVSPGEDLHHVVLVEVCEEGADVMLPVPADDDLDAGQQVLVHLLLQHLHHALLVLGRLVHVEDVDKGLDGGALDLVLQKGPYEGS